jgi:glutathione S-transferase
MESITIYLGNKTISSWSLRAWLMLLQTGADFKAVFIDLNQENSKEKIAKISPSGKVPVLHFGDAIIWDSLAIGEFLAEEYPKAALWPQNHYLRSMARSISCEMHAGFHELRKHLPFNSTVKIQNFSIPEDAKKDISRVIQIWEDCLNRSDNPGPFLFGKFSIADAMFAPVVLRFLSYNVLLTPMLERYAGSMIQLPEMQMWCNEI